MLDQILISKALAVAPRGTSGPAFDDDIVHTNSEFHDQDCDHDPSWRGSPSAAASADLPVRYAGWLVAQAA